jgi:hypothetical protein
LKAHPDTVYRGERVQTPAGGFRRGSRWVRVFASDMPLSLPSELSVGSGFEWGYSGAGPAQLALALVLHATGDRELALRTYRWFMLLKVYCWGSTWRITAEEVVRLVEEFDRDEEGEDEGEPEADAPTVLGPDRVRTDQAHAPPEANADDWLRRMFDERGGEL